MLPGLTLLAHQGGWDEALMVLAPVGIFGGLLYVAFLRAGEDEDEGASSR